MTLIELIETDKVYLTPADIAPVLHCDAQSIRAQAKRDEKLLGYPVIIIGNRVKIPRIPFLRFLGLLD